jgi:hypothetical protein
MNNDTRKILKKENNYNTILPTLFVFFLIYLILFGWILSFNRSFFLFGLPLLIVVTIIYIIRKSYKIEVHNEGIELKTLFAGKEKKKPCDVFFSFYFNQSVYAIDSKKVVLVFNQNKIIARLKFKNEKEIEDFYINTLQYGYKWKRIPEGSRLNKIKTFKDSPATARKKIIN